MKRMILALVLFCSSTAMAGRVDRDLGELATIQDGEGRARVLFRWEPSLGVERAAVWNATLRFSLTGEASDRILPIVIYPITSAWNSGSVSWSSGWSAPGGDFDEELFARAEFDLSSGGRPVSVDVTALVKEIVESDYACHGFLVTLDPREGIGFSGGDVGRLENLAEASIEVSYRRTPEPPRTAARGLKEKPEKSRTVRAGP